MALWRAREGQDAGHREVLAAVVRRVELVAVGPLTGHGLGDDRVVLPAVPHLLDDLDELLRALIAVVVRGMPWNTVAIVEWRDSFTLRDGSARSNQGVHVLSLRWGKVVSLRIYTDTQKLTDILRELRAQGVAEAGFMPIADA